MLVGLTGNVAAGKSSVLALLSRWGATVVDSDVLAREAVEPGTPGLAAVVARFGDRFLLPDGTLDRAALRRHVMADRSERDALNAVVHPIVRRKAAELAAAAFARGDLIVVEDVPLLFEVRDPADFDVIVLVDAPVRVRRERLMQGRALTRDDADAIIAAQLPSGPKRIKSDVVVDNPGTRAELESRALGAWQRLRALAARRSLGPAATPPRSLLAVFAHPDDETYGPGAALARYAEAGLDVHVLCATGGEAAKRRAGHADPDALRRHREQELREACLVLGVRTLELLRRRDRTLDPDDPSGAAWVAAAIRRTRPDAILTFGEDGISGHPDHRAVHHWTRRAWDGEGRPGALWYVAITEETAARSPRPGLLGRPGPEIAAVLDGRPWLDAMEAAIRCHASQHFPLPLDTPEWRERVGREVFGREGSGAGAAAPVTDLFLLDTAKTPR